MKRLRGAVVVIIALRRSFVPVAMAVGHCAVLLMTSCLRLLDSNLRRSNDRGATVAAVKQHGLS